MRRRTPSPPPAPPRLRALLLALAFTTSGAAACGEVVPPWLQGDADASIADTAGADPGPDAAPDNAELPIPPCTVEAPTACPVPPPSYAEVSAIIEARCLGCHYGYVGGPWPLVTYDQIAAWREDLRSSILDCWMPPPEEHLPMTDAERSVILEWIRCDMPEDGSVQTAD